MKPGIYPDLSNEDYHAGPGISSSGLTIIHERTPAHYIASRQEPRNPTPALIDGERLHYAITQPDEFDRRYTVMPTFDLRTKAGKEGRAEWEAENEGKTGIAQDKLDTTRRIRDAVHASPPVARLLAKGYAERSVFAKDPVTGVLVKCRPDFESLVSAAGVLVDLKSTADAREAKFMRDAYNYGYHRAAPFYSDVCEWQSGTAPDAFVFVAFEKEPPFGVIVYEPDQRFINRGRMEYRAALNTYANCLLEGEWPCYPHVVHSLSLPAWVKDEDNDEVKDIGYVE